MTRLRRALHPLVPALALLTGCVGVAATGSAGTGTATGPVLAVLAGCAAGFANSGST